MKKRDTHTRLTPLRALRAYRMAIIARTRAEAAHLPLFEHIEVVAALETHLESLLARRR